MTGTTYSIVDTGQTTAYGASDAFTSPPAAGSSFYGQDAHYSGNQPSYRDNGDGTVSDLVTGLMWQQAPTANVSHAVALAGASSATTGGHSDWRLPTIDELYSLIRFSGYTGTDAASSRPYIDSSAFSFSYGDTAAGERFIDAQYWSSTTYVGTTMNGAATAFGVNFADGRIKGYPTADKLGEVLYVRGNTSYGVNQFTANGDGTVSDSATGLMWLQADSGAAMTWEQALAWAEGLTTAGHSDWRLPNIKELQSLADYTRAPSPTTATAATTGPAIDPVFSLTNIGTAASPDYPYVWSGTTHVENGTGNYASYMTFGQAWGWMQGSGGGYTLMDVHGAGAQRSDPKTGNAADYPYGFGPQGDVIRIENYAIAVRDLSTGGATSGNDLLTGGAGGSLDGGAGIDTVSYTGARAGHTVSAAGGTITVAGSGFTDTLVNVERLAFSDGTLAFDVDGACGQAYRLYKAAFDRAAEAGGLGYWTGVLEGGTSLRTVAESFMNSAEFGVLYGAATTTEGLVTQFYTNVLDRAPDAGGLAYWAGLAGNGTSLADILVAFSESTENRATQDAVIAQGVWYV